MAGRLIAENLVLQGDADAQNHTIFNLNLSGLNLTKASVGLGNVDNTSDLNKPLSTAVIAALTLKQDLIVAGTTSQFYRGDKTFVNYGALALQDGATTLPILSSIGAAANASSLVSARRNDYNSSFAQTSIVQFGAGSLANVLFTLPGANAGALAFDFTSAGVIKTNNNVPIIFGINNTKRMRLQLGLNVGGDADPGAGCIAAFGTITGGHLAGIGDGITGLVKEQIPTTLRASTFPSLRIVGAAGAGFIDFSAQTSDPTTAFACIFANSAGQIAIREGGTPFRAAFNLSALTADRTLALLNAAGTLPVIVAVPATATSTGVAGSEAYDATHFYKCISPNVWVRCTLATW